MGRNRVDQRHSAGSRSRRAWTLPAAIAIALALAPAASAASFGAAAWGYNESGQLGNGSTTLSRVPVGVSGLTGVSAVAAGGGEHSLALLSDGTVMAWGNNREGQLGNGTTTNSHVPVAVSGLTGVTAIAAGRVHSLALLGNGTVMAWGGNEEGQLGTGKTTKSAVPVAVKGLTGATAISAGSEFNLARLGNGTVVSWGSNSEGQLGNGKMSKSLVPVAVKGLSGVSAVSAGGEHSLALLGNGKVMSWGSNLARQLGVPAEIVKEGGGEEEEIVEEVEAENSDVPVDVQAISGVTAVAAGGEHSLALLGNGQVVAWGNNHSDQLGNGSTGGADNVPSAVTGLTGATAIAAGSRHSLALLSGGAVAAWGYNPDGQLGNGSNLNSPVPVTIGGLGGTMGIAAGGAHSLSFGPPAPSVSGVSPSSGPQPGGTSVTITGVNLGEASAVHFGANAASSFAVNSATSITAVAPAGTGVVDVTVSTPVATSTTSTADRFTYVPPPTVTKVTLNKGPAAGGTSVTITGTSFTGATVVSFGSGPASSFTVNSPSSITAVSPPGSTGTVDVTVSTPSGTSALSTHDHFKYEAPTIVNLSPSSGPTAGGTSVTVTGSGFAIGAGTTVFKFAKAAASGVNCASSTVCTIVSPAAKAGVVEVRATVGNTSSKINQPGDRFTYS